MKFSVPSAQTVFPHRGMILLQGTALPNRPCSSWLAASRGNLRSFSFALCSFYEVTQVSDIFQDRSQATAHGTLFIICWQIISHLRAGAPLSGGAAHFLFWCTSSASRCTFPCYRLHAFACVVGMSQSSWTDLEYFEMALFFRRLTNYLWTKEKGEIVWQQMP